MDHLTMPSATEISNQMISLCLEASRLKLQSKYVLSITNYVWQDTFMHKYQSSNNEHNYKSVLVISYWFKETKSCYFFDSNCLIMKEHFLIAWPANKNNITENFKEINPKEVLPLRLLKYIYICWRKFLSKKNIT